MRLLSFFFALFLTFMALPVNAEEPFLAIYTSGDFSGGWVRYFDKRKIDLLFCAASFEDFDKFLTYVRQLSKGKPVIIDLSVHGCAHSGMISLTDGAKWDKKTHDYTNWSYSNLGYIVNHIRSHLHEEKVTLVLECCYAPTCFMKGLRTFLTAHCKNVITETYDDGADVPFPIYGLAISEPNYCRLSLEDYLSGDPQLVVDLRKYDDPYELMPHESITDSHKNLLMLYKYENLIQKQ